MATAPRKIFAGPRLKRLRRDRHLTQAAMAAELDVSPSYLNLMERNQRPITVQVLIKLTDVYGIDPRDFMEVRGRAFGRRNRANSRRSSVSRGRGSARRGAGRGREFARLARRHGAALPRLFGGAGSDRGGRRRRRATATAPNPFWARARSTGSAPSCRRRATISRNLEDAAETFAAELRAHRQRSFLCSCANIFGRVTESACVCCRSRSWATGCAGMIITAAN